MKKFFLTVATLLLVVNLQGAPLEQTHSVDGYSVAVSSEKSLVRGSNAIYFQLEKDAQKISDAKVRVKFFMPEMPGMPYMESKARAKKDGDRYKVMINFSMGGTWQYQLEFKTKDGEVHKMRGSVNI